MYRAAKYREALPVLESLAGDSSFNRRDAAYDPDAHVGAIYARLGDKARADSVIRFLLSFRDPPLEATSLHNAARIAAVMGERDRAVDYLRRYVAISGRAGMFHFDNSDIDGLLDYPPYRTLIDMRDKSAPVASLQEKSRRR